jgi:mono/diheme cytochrome c family protein
MTKIEPNKHKAIVFFLIALAALSFSAVVTTTTPVAHAEEDDGRPKIVVPRRGGRDIFSEYCVLCHKYDGRGGPSEGGYGADLRKTTLTREQLIIIIAYGRQAKGMPPFKDLLDSDKIETLADFILTDLRLPELKDQ